MRKIVAMSVAIVLIISGISIVVTPIIAIDRNTANSAETIAETALLVTSEEQPEVLADYWTLWPEWTKLVANEELPGTWAGYWILSSGLDKENSNFCGVGATIEPDIQPGHYFVLHVWYKNKGLNFNNETKELAFMAFLNQNATLGFNVHFTDIIEGANGEGSVGSLKYNKSHPYRMSVLIVKNVFTEKLILNCYAKDLETNKTCFRTWELNSSWVVEGSDVDVALERQRETKNSFVKYHSLVYCKFEEGKHKCYPWTNTEDNNLTKGEWLYLEHDIEENKVYGEKDYINNSVWIAMAEK